MVGGGLRLARTRAAQRRAARGSVPWPAVGLAALVITGCGAGGANDGFTAMLLAIAEFVLAASIFIRQPLPTGAMRQAAPVLALIGALLAWAGLPGLAALWPGPLRWITPALEPDLYPQAYAGVAGAMALFVGAVVLGANGGRRAFAVWLGRFGAGLMGVTLGLRLVGAPLGMPMEDDRMYRFAGTLGNPNVAGVAYAMLTLLLTGLAILRVAAWRSRRDDRRALEALAAVLMVLVGAAMVGLTLSRSALILLTLGEMVLIGAQFPRRRWPLMAGLGLLLVAGLASATLDRFAPLGADGVDRLYIWRHYGGAAVRAPLSGHGLGSFIAFNQAQLTPTTAPVLWSFGAAHAAPLQVVLELGWPGLLLVGAGVGLVMGRLLRALAPARDPVGTALVLAVMVALGGSMVDIALNVPGIMALSLALAGVCWGRSLTPDRPKLSLV